MKTKIASIFVIFLCIACKTNPKNVKPNSKIIVNNSIYNETKIATYTIQNVSLTNNLLKVTIASGGCDGSTWVANLVDSGNIAESLPVQRYATIQLKNEETCMAIVTKEFIFNISDLKIGDQTIFHIKGWKETVTLK